MSIYIDADDFFDTFPELEIEPYKNFQPADVVSKEKYDRLLESAKILAEAVSRYQEEENRSENDGREGNWNEFGDG